MVKQGSQVAGDRMTDKCIIHLGDKPEIIGKIILWKDDYILIQYNDTHLVVNKDLNYIQYVKRK